MEKRTCAFEVPARVIFGPGCVAQLPEACKPLGRQCVLVTGRSAMRRSGALDRVRSLFDEAGVHVALYDRIDGEPDVAAVDSIRSLIHQSRADFVAGLGGGSPIDAAKAAAGLARETQPASFFLREQKEARPGLPIVAIATTSGTGAEATPNAVICDREMKLKASLRNGAFLPAVAVVDPELTVSCPPRVTAHSGMDALAQAVESFVSIHANALSDAVAFEAFRLLWSSLQRAYTDGSDLQARAACAYGSLMAGIALANARLGAVHGMAHPLGVRYGIPHGLICAVLLPEVVRINLPCSAAKFARLAAETGSDLVTSLIDLNRRLGIYDDFRQYEIPEEDFGIIARESMPSGSMKANPRKFTVDDALAVLNAVTKGGAS